MAKLEDYKIIRVSGVDTLTFLQGQLSCDVATVTAQHFSLACHCNIKGRIISSFFVVKDNDDFLLVVPASNFAKAIDNLKKYAIFSKVTLSDSTDDFVFAGRSEKLNSDSNCQVDGSSIILQLADELQLCMMRANSVSDKIASLSESEWALACIENKIIHITDKLSEQLLPHRLDLHKTTALSFDKGCYTGQEVIARMHYKSTQKHQLAIIELSTDSEEESNLQPLTTLKGNDNKAIKIQIINCQPSNNKSLRALCIIPLDGLQSELQFNSEDGAIFSL